MLDWNTMAKHKDAHEEKAGALSKDATAGASLDDKNLDGAEATSSEKPRSEHKKSRILLRIVSILLIIVGVISVLAYVLFGLLVAITAAVGYSVDLYLTVGDGTALSSVLGVIMFVASVSTSFVQLSAGRRGMRLARGKGSAERCQLLGILMIGLAIISWLISVIATSGGTTFDFIDFVLSFALPFFYYALARHELHNSFWEGIKEDEGDEGEPEAVVPLPEVIAERYELSAGGMLVPSDSSIDTVVEFLSTAEFAASMPESAAGRMASRTEKNIRHCTANTFGSAIFGTVRIPQQALELLDLPFKEDVAFAFRLEDNVLSIVSDNDDARQLMAFYALDQIVEKIDAAAALFELLDFVTTDNNAFMFDQQERLNHLESNMAEDVNEIPHDFDKFVSETRAQLLVLESFYRQLSDLASKVAESSADVLSQRTRELFRALCVKAARLNVDAQMLCEHALQIRDIYQSKIDVRQNKVMSILTIVTSFFMPLTLITGWYGTNFDVMPELHFKYSYLVVFIVAISIVTTEAIIFKRKKWF